ncbi:DUF3631 domain-containing protein [Actinomadura sp. SCN-SB]|uniref:DUF3631 domain-containing protein n=1 Tax=Actinomadura sp. SCN-SB TaxID=3373092 RepID=UPI003750CEFE
MRRRAPGETVAPFRYKRDRPPLRRLAADLHRWLRADLETLERAEPAMPVEDRAADTWEPLVAVADHAGGHWPARARAAVLALTAEAEDNSQLSPRLRLLVDCRTAFGADTALPTAVLLDRLKADPEAPWNDYGPNGLTAMKLGALLREYDIRSDTIRFPGTGKQAKGYHRADFLDAWARYCPAHEPPATPVRDATVLTLPGTAVPAVPASKPQVTAGTASNPGTA